MLKNIILIPIYNDWKSLNNLLLNIDKHFENKKNNIVEILVIDDNSSKELSMIIKIFSLLKKLK